MWQNTLFEGGHPNMQKQCIVDCKSFEESKMQEMQQTITPLGDVAKCCIR
jgi:hypothetical protein